MKFLDFIILQRNPDIAISRSRFGFQRQASITPGTSLERVLGMCRCSSHGHPEHVLNVIGCCHGSRTRLVVIVLPIFRIVFFQQVSK